jgi:hypothetical protein
MLQAGEQCPVTPASTVSVPNVASVLGDGPVFPWGTGRASLGDLFFDGDVYRLKVLWIIDQDRYADPALIRGARIDGPSPTPLLFFYGNEGPYAELRLGREGWVYGGTGMHEFNSGTGFPGMGCFAYQVDGLGIQFTVVVEISE